MKGIMVELILWTENPQIDIENISKIINIYPVEKESIGDIKYYGEFKNLKRVIDASSLVYSTGYINTKEVEQAFRKMLSIIKPKLDDFIGIINKYNINTKFCITIALDEEPIVSIPPDIVEITAQLHSEIDFDIYLFWGKN